ncbi:Early nodulin-like protein 1 [Apostasia shenzhenica]|uniref:Early nodulin-like protein 1 n=1 Tax=Apostasia shenzhenica TaxID=1088818 RepID=A0A2I0B5X7_9ASPA|nr:Early nodulin-like protein 1 [Apostasia shenzhenica]
MAGGARKAGSPAAIFALILAVVLPAASAEETHIVGGSTGWTTPLNSSFYSDWSSSQKFAAGDVLVFNFQQRTHEVVEVSKSGFDSCSAVNPLGPPILAGPASLTLTDGDHYFICGFPGHCTQGQKLAVAVAIAVTSSHLVPPVSGHHSLAPAPASGDSHDDNPSVAPAPMDGGSSGGKSSAATSLASSFEMAAAAVTVVGIYAVTLAF